MDINQYKNRLNIVNEDLKVDSKLSSKYSLYRLISFLIFLVLMGIYFILENRLALYISVILIVIFTFLVFNHKEILKKIRKHKLVIQTLNQYISRYDDRWQTFEDGGLDFASLDKPFLHDLDIIGETSLFKYLSVCKTANGRNKLLYHLSNHKISNEELTIRQQAILEICENLDFSIAFQSSLKDYALTSSRVSLYSAIKNINSKVNIKKYHFYVIMLLILSTITVFFLSLFKVVNWLILLEVFLIQLIYANYLYFIYKDAFKEITNTALAITSLKDVFQTIKVFKFQNNTLINNQQSINKYGILGIKEINRIKEIDSYRMNLITNVILNGLFSLNFFILWFYNSFQKKYGENIHLSIEALEDFEVYTSLAILGQIKSNKCLPNLTENLHLDFDDLKHPLIIEEDCVSNSFSNNSKVNIITGSNMSGKTFFLRTIGINLILMNAGAYVNSKSFSAPYFRIFTSMRIADDISKGISTFYAELLRIKTAIEYSKKGQPMIVLVDEVFKGTNSNDRITGAISLIKRLSLDNVILFITTHDFELCSAEDVDNYHFSESYQGEKIVFDHILKQGRCLTTNAKHLMKLVGIIE